MAISAPATELTRGREGEGRPLTSSSVAPSRARQQRIITAARFVSADLLEFTHCDRAQTIADDGRDFSLCGADGRTDLARLVPTSSGLSVEVLRRSQP